MQIMDYLKVRADEAAVDPNEAVAEDYMEALREVGVMLNEEE